MAQNDIRIYADILNESSVYKRECEDTRDVADAIAKEIAEDEYDKLEDEIIDPQNIGFVDSELDEVEDASRGQMTLEFVDFVDIDGMKDVLVNFIKYYKLTPDDLSYELGSDDLHLTFTGKIDILKDIYAIYKGYNDFEEFAKSEPNDFDDAVEVLEDDSTSESDTSFEDRADEDVCSIAVEIYGSSPSEISDFRKVVKSAANVTTSVDPKTSKILMRGALEEVKKAYAFACGAEDFDSLSDEDIDDFNAEIEFEDGDSLAECDYRQDLADKLNEQTCEEEVEETEIQKLTKKVESLQKQLDRASSKMLNEEDEIANVVKDKIEDAAEASEEDVGEDIFTPKENDAYDKLGDDYAKKISFIDSKLKQTGLSTKQQEQLKSLKDTLSLLFKTTDPRLKDQPLGKFFGAPSTSTVKRITNTYKDANGRTKQIFEILPPELWQQYDKLRIARRHGQLTPEQQKIYDYILSVAENAQITDHWVVYAQSDNDRKVNGAVPSWDADDENGGPKEYGSRGGGDTGTGYAQSDFEEVARRNADVKQDTIDHETSYEGPIPTFNPDYDRDLATDLRSTAKGKKILNKFTSMIDKQKALDTAKKIRGNDDWTLEEWVDILKGMDLKDRKDLYHDLVTIASARADQKSDEVGALKKLFGQKIFAANRIGASTKNAAEMTADQLKKAASLRSQESQEFKAFFLTMKDALAQMSVNHPSDITIKALSAMMNRLYKLRYQTTAEEWKNYGEDAIISGKWWRKDGWPKNVIEFDKFLDMKNGGPKIDKKTGEPKPIVVPSQKAVMEEVYLNTIIPALLSHLLDSGDVDLLNEWGDLIAVKSGKKTKKTTDDKKKED